MGVPTSEVGYTSAIPRREDHEVRQGHVGHWIKKHVQSAIRRSLLVQTVAEYEAHGMNAKRVPYKLHTSA